MNWIKQKSDEIFLAENIVFLLVFLFPVCLFGKQVIDNKGVRQIILLNSDWKTAENDSNRVAFSHFEKNDFNDRDWMKVDVPHNWDDYGGYRRMVHGNRHGTAWYRKSFSIEKQEPGKRYFLMFEGVSSYATIWLNGDSVGYHAGGRTSFTLDVTKFIHPEAENMLAVRADHPANIRDLPWVCGGCSTEFGFSEGSQPMGIFRPVRLIVTNQVRVEPFGIHIWNDEKISAKSASLNLTIELKNYSNTAVSIRLVNALKDALGKTVQKTESDIKLSSGQCDTIPLKLSTIENPHLWSLEDPYLYHVQTEIYQDGKLLDTENTSYGIRWIKWDRTGEKATHRFYLNDQPVFINGTSEYEHLLGQSHAFTDEQIEARISQFRAAGYNAFRDAHQPHNLLYKNKIDSLGILWWPQMAAHIWFDTPEFRGNFKQLLTDWIKERRNSPSIILWGLENESSLPTDFAEECTALIRKLDPTASSQRLITTCNGGAGTDWNVIQNWSGTYGGNPENYAYEITKQLLNGEYGALRSIDLHSEGGFVQNGPISEDRFNLLMESKIRLAESVKDSCFGQFHWLLASHDNPGRTHGGEGFRELDRLGPVNYKGAMSIWGEPLDVYYMYRANYAPKETQPMVYIVSHTWPDRWTEPGIKKDIQVFSNCDEVELFNGIREHSLGRKINGGRGTHFTWDNVDIQNNLLYAVGFVNGKEVAQDQIVLNHLPKAGNLEKLAGKVFPLTETKNLKYIYRVNCGGPDYIDRDGNLWMADVHLSGENYWGSRSWTDDYPGLPAFYGSQRQTHDPIAGTLDWPLIQTFRYGRQKLSYEFPVPDGIYQLELYFTEPWYGTGGGLDCKGWRIFDVAVNDEVKIHDLDIWKEAGHDQLLKKTLNVAVSGGKLKISFPNVKAGQAVISAIAISGKNRKIKPAPASQRLITDLSQNKGFHVHSWMNSGDKSFSDGDVQFVSLPPDLYGAEWISTPQSMLLPSGEKPFQFKVNADADVYIGIQDSTVNLNTFNKCNKIVRTSQNGGTNYYLFQKRSVKNERIDLSLLNLNRQTSVLIAVVLVNKMDAVIDLRPIVTYKPADAKTIGSAQRINFLDKDCILVPGKGDGVEWQISVGLGSKYGLEFRYFSTDLRALKVEMSILAADGTMVWKGPLELNQPGEKWKSLRTDTQTTINAGTYKLRIRLLDSEKVYFNYLKIQ